MSKASKIGLGVLAAVLVAGFLVASYLGGWWLREDAVNRTSQINNDSYARQSALADEIIDLHSQVTDLDVRAAGDVTATQKELILTQRAALIENLCTSHGQMIEINNIPADIHAFAAQEC